MGSESLKVQIESDLHLEFLRESWREGLPAPAPGVGACVFAGDVHSGPLSVQAACDFAQRHGIRVFWVAGNHEFYGGEIDALVRRFEVSAGFASSMGVDLLEFTGPVDFEGWRVMGSTLWTDCALYEGSVRMPTAEEAERAIEMRIADFRSIREKGLPFRAGSMRVRHAAMRARLDRDLDLAVAEGIPAMVVSHHLPLLECVHPMFSAGSRALESRRKLPAENPHWMANPAFASRLDPLVAKASAWIHGHTHASVDLRFGGCRVLANPRGYPRELFGGLVFENDGYRAAHAFGIGRADPEPAEGGPPSGGVRP